MRLVFEGTLRRFVGLALLLFCAVPVGLSVAGCSKATAVTYCNAQDNGPTTGQVASIVLSPSFATTGESLNYGQMGSSLSATALDCKGNNVSVRSYTYATTDMSIADVNPFDGQVCGGTWNRNTGGGVPDYSICTAPATTPANFTAYITATASGAVSNSIAVYVHPVATGIVLGGATPPGACPSTALPNGNDPGTDCCPFITTTGTPIVAPVYTGTGCISQGTQGQLIGRVYANGKVDAADNITCRVGHLTFLPQSASNVVTIDTTGVATANQPGSTTITAQIANSSTGSSAGFFSTCPPTNITLSVPGQSGSSFNDPINNLLPITAVVTDKNGVQLTGLNLEYNSTLPQNIPATTGSVTPQYPGTATITAACLPGSCNTAPFSQIGLYGNGQPLTSNGITVTATGTSSAVIYMASTQSQYVQPQDLTTGQTSAQLKLPFVPNSMVISQSGASIYFGSSFGIMSINTTANTVSAANQNVTGTVLAVSPDGGTVVITDPVRQTVSLYSTSSSSITAVTNGIGTRAQWTPDSQNVYVTTTTGTLLTHSSFTGWQSTALTGVDTTYSDVAVTVPSVGAYFAGTYTEGRSYCPSGTLTGTGTPQSVNNIFAPLADEDSATTDRLAATTDGNHILGAHANGAASTLSDVMVSSASLKVTSPCPQAGTPVTQTYFSSTPTTKNLIGVIVTGTTSAPPISAAPTGITGVVPSSNSAVAFVTYTGTSGLLPLYVPSTGALSFLTLGNGATTASSPVTGVFTADNLLFFAGTQGASGAPADNDVHQFSISGTSATETGVITPNLPCFTVSAACPNVAPVNLLAQRVKRSTT